MKEETKTETETKRTGTIHDGFFRRVFMDMELCKEFLKAVLTKKELALFDLTTVKAERDTFIDKDLAEHRSDVIVSIKFKGMEQKVKVFFLLEHKSYKDTAVLLQILKYQAEVYLSKEYKREKTPVYTVLIYQGERPWDFSGNFQDSELKDFPPEARKVMKEQFLNFTCRYLDLQKINLKRKTGHKALMLSLFVMKNIWRIDDEIVKKIILDSKDLVKDDQYLIHDILSYIMKYDKKYKEKEKFYQLEDKVLKEEEKFMGTTLLTTIWEDDARKEGLEEGKKKGKKEGLKAAAAVLGMLKEGIGLEKIQKITELSKDEIEELKKLV